MEEITSLMYYYMRNKLWNSLLKLCTKELKNGFDPQFVFWKAFGIFNTGSVTDAIREIEAIQNRRDIQLAAYIALSFYHSNCTYKDEQAISAYETQISEVESASPDAGLITAGYFSLFINDFQRAKKIAQIPLDRNSNYQYPDAVVLKAWADYSSSNEAGYTEQINNLNNLLLKVKHLEGMIAKFKILQASKQIKPSEEALNDIIISFPKFVPGLIEKTKFLINSCEYSQIIDHVNRILALDSNNIEAFIIKIFYTLAKEGNISESQTQIDKLIKLIEAQEPKNCDLLLFCSKLFSRVSCNRPEILSKTMDFLNKSLQINPNNAYYLSEIAYQKTLLSDYTGAINIYKQASSIDDELIDPLYGMIYCNVRRQLYEDIENQLTFLKDFQKTKTAMHPFIESMINREKFKNSTKSLAFINECLSIHLSEAKFAHGLEYYIKLNPAFLIEITKELLLHQDPLTPVRSENPPIFMTRACKILEMLMKQTPGNFEAHLLYARAKSGMGLHKDAINCINNAIASNPDNVEVYILGSKINREQKNYAAALGYLEQALAQNFKIRSNPNYMLEKGQLELMNNDFKSAVQTLEAAYELPGVKDKIRSDDTSPNMVKDEDRITIFVSLMECYSKTEKEENAKKVMQKAIAEFSGTPFEIKVIMANSDLALRSGNLKNALNMLKKIPPTSPFFKDAKIKMAETYLTYLMDRRHFTKCYLDILKSEETTDNYKLVGDALMRIQEPEEAIEFYDKAHQQSGDPQLVKIIGKALVMTHAYSKAEKYYKDAIQQDPNQISLVEDLAFLLFQTQNFEASLKEIESGLAILNSTENPDIDQLCILVSLMDIKSQIVLKANCPLTSEDIDQAYEILSKAIEIHSKVVEKMREISSEKLPKEKERGAQLCCKLGELAEKKFSDSNEVISIFKKALNFNSEHKPTLNTMAKKYMKLGKYEQAILLSMKLLKMDPSNDESCFVSAECQYLFNQEEQALQTYLEFLSSNPNSFKIHTKYIQLLHRCGKTKDISTYVDKVSKVAPRPNDPGLAFLKGSYNRLILKPKESLRNFNIARGDANYSKDSLFAMIDLYLDPDFYFAPEVAYNSNFHEEYVGSAITLIQEIESRSVSDIMITIYFCFASIATKNKASVDASEAKLEEILKVNPNHAPTIVILAFAKIVNKKVADAKNILMNLLKIPYDPESSVFFERGYLLHAYLQYINTKEDLAIQACQTCLKVNSANINSYELLGVIKEDNNDSLGAADLYEKAWQLSGKSSARIGLRLAQCYLTAKKYVQCISVCKDVLDKFPDNPNIENEILSKALSLLRT